MKALILVGGQSDCQLLTLISHFNYVGPIFDINPPQSILIEDMSPFNGLWLWLGFAKFILGSHLSLGFYS